MAHRRSTRRLVRSGDFPMLSTERLESRQLLAATPSVVPETVHLQSLADDTAIVPIAPGLVRAATTIGPSGDPRIEALRSGVKWGTSNLTYSFYAGGSYYGSEANPTPVSDAVKANVRFIFSQIISPAVNVTFTEVTDTPTNYGLLRFLCSTSANYAYAYLPTAGDTNTGTSSDVVGDVVLRTSFDVAGADTNSFRLGPGSHGFTALIHEIGHALGLKHSFESPSPLPTAEDNLDNTVMTYTFKGSEPATLMPYDLLALQYFYGANTGTRSGDTVYTFTKTDVFSPGSGSTGAPTAAFSTMRNTLWDTGGNDTIDLASLPAEAAGYRVDIQPGGWITATSSYNSVVYSGTFTTTNFGTRVPLSGTTIENIVVSGSSDALFLNSAANRISGYRPGVGTGSDVISGSDQADTLDLSTFLESSVLKSQLGNDLILNLGTGGGTVMIKNYYAVGATSRMAIVYATPPSVSVAATDAEKVEGTGAGPTGFTFTVTRAGGLTAASTVAWAVAGSGGNPADAADFTGGVLPSGSVSFAVGESSKTITVTVSADATIESDESFTVTLSAPTGAALGSPLQATGTIRNDDFPAVTIAASAADKAEGTGGGPTSFTFTVTRPSAATGAASVAWAVTGSGVNPADAADFAGGVLPSGILAFAAGETSKTITLNVATDGVIEADEGFTITLSSPTGATLGSPAQGSGTIRNDDFPAITIAAAAADKPEGTGASPTGFTFMVTLQSGFAGSSSVAWALAGSGPKPANAADFSGGVLPNGTVSFAAGETSKSITVNVAADTLPEPDEGFTVTLSSPSGATLGVPAQASGTIRNDDTRSRISIAAADAVRSEGDIGRTPFTFRLTRTGDLSGEVSVPWSIVGSGAYRADRFDFIGGVLPSGTIRLAAGRQTQALIVNVFCDRIAEFDEEFTITLGTPLGGLDIVEPGLGSAAATIRNDDPGTPRPAPAMPVQRQAVQGQIVAGLAGDGALATAQAIAAQAFATLAESAGSSGTSTAKRIGAAATRT